MGLAWSMRPRESWLGKKAALPWRESVCHFEPLQIDLFARRPCEPLDPTNRFRIRPLGDPPEFAFSFTVCPLMVQEPASRSASGKRSDGKDTLQFVGFQIEDQLYAFPIEKIQEIVILEQITATPQVAPHVEGVSNLRGEIIPIINLRRLLGMPPRPSDSETRTIVVNVGSRTIGCTVDAVTQVIRIAKDNIQDAPEASPAAAFTISLALRS